MKNILLLLPLITLLTACQSNKDICARFFANQFSIEVAAKKLGIKGGVEQCSFVLQ